MAGKDRDRRQHHRHERRVHGRQDEVDSPWVDHQHLLQAAGRGRDEDRGTLEQAVGVGHVIPGQRGAVVERRLDEPAADDRPVTLHRAGAVGEVGDRVVAGVVTVERALNEGTETDGWGGDPEVPARRLPELVHLDSVVAPVDAADAQRVRVRRRRGRGRDGRGCRRCGGCRRFLLRAAARCQQCGAHENGACPSGARPGQSSHRQSLRGRAASLCLSDRWVKVQRALGSRPLVRPWCSRHGAR